MVRKSTCATMFLAALMLMAVSCNTPSFGPTAPCQVTVSKQAADRMIQRIAQQVTARGKTITVTASNEEVSSVLDQFLQQAKINNPNDFIPLDHPVVCFQNGTMSIFGGVQWGANNPVDGIVTLSAAVKDGKPAFSVQQIQVGPVTVPSDLSDELSQLVNRAISQYLTQVTLTDIRLQNGQIALSGQVRLP
jgi:hypothetical protein